MLKTNNYGAINQINNIFLLYFNNFCQLVGWLTGRTTAKAAQKRQADSFDTCAGEYKVFAKLKLRQATGMWVGFYFSR